MDKIKQAIASDCERIIEAFVSTGNYEFQSFCNEWKRMQFQHIYSALMREIEIIQMTEAIFSTIGRILFENSHLTGQKIAALYLMYAIFFKQPTEQHIKFKLTLNNWKTLKGFIESIKDDPNTLEVRYIFYKLLSVNAFRFVVLERDCSLEPGLDRISSQKNNDEHSESIFNDDVNELAHPTRGYLESLSILEGGYNEMKRILNQNEETKSHSSFQKLESFNVIERFKSSFSKISDLLKKDADEDDSDENGSDSSYRKKREPVKRKATICEKRASIRNKAKSFRRREPTEDNGYDISLSGDMIQISKKTDNRVRSKQQNVEKLFSQKLSDDTLNELAYIEELPITETTTQDNYYKQEAFEFELEEFAQKCVQANLGRIVEQEVRVSAKNNDHAFIKSWGSERDAMFKAQILRKGALHGDVVRAFIRKDAEQPDSSSAQNSNESTTSEADLTACLEGDSALPERSSKAFVIKIVKEVNNRRVVGNFLSHRKDSKYITFLPRDMKVPNLRIFEKHWPESFKNGKLDDIGNSLYVAEIIGWQDEICLGKILQPIGKCGELDSENKAILLQNNLDFEPYAEKFNEQYADAFVIPAEEYQKREDIRNECVFTIDPLTARDLDDALSCKQLHNGTFEIGVHISDVLYFLAEDDELDKIVEKRTTSVYMVNEVFHMLPKPLCYRCSLLPAEDKLTFSVFWTMSASGEILSTRFSRTVIKSCTQFAYQHAQLIIDNPEKEFHESDFPPIHNGFSVADVVLCVRHNFARKTFR